MKPGLGELGSHSFPRRGTDIVLCLSLVLIACTPTAPPTGG